jgi:preprotein translocase subunit SecG
MFKLAIIIHILVSIVLIITVLLQAGKGASIGSTFGGTSSQALFGTSGPTTFLSKITTVCAIIFMLTSLYLTFLTARKDTGSIMTGVPTVKEAPAPAETAPEPGKE